MRWLPCPYTEGLDSACGTFRVVVVRTDRGVAKGCVLVDFALPPRRRLTRLPSPEAARAEARRRYGS